jgi:hypothetical protein
MVDHCRDLRVRIDVDKARAELVALADIDEPGIVLSALVYPAASSSSSITVTLTPFGVASE